MVYLILFIIGLISAIFGSLIGLGGGIIIVPSLLFLGHMGYFQEMTQHTVVALSLATMVFTGYASTKAYMKSKLVDYKAGLLFFIGAGPGGLAGAWLNTLISIDAFYLYFGLFIVLMSFLLMFRDKLPTVTLRSGIRRTFVNEYGDSWDYQIPPVIAVIVSFFVGTLSGLFGIGGGSLMVPVMMLIFRMPTSLTVGTSMFLILMTAFVSVIGHVSLGHVIWMAILPLMIGAFVGARIGASWHQTMKSDTVILIFRVALILIGIDLILQGITHT